MSKSCKKHLLSNKSKKQKKLNKKGMPLDPVNVKEILRMLPGNRA